MSYNHTNNGHAILANPISETSTTLLLGGTYETLPTSNFIVRISKYASDVLTGRENVYIANRTGATCTGVVRAFEPVPINDSSNVQVQQGLPFSAWDVVECVISSKFIESNLRSGMSIDSVAITDALGNETFSQNLPSAVLTNIWASAEVQNQLATVGKYTVSLPVAETLGSGMWAMCAITTPTQWDEWYTAIPHLSSNSQTVSGVTYTLQEADSNFPAYYMFDGNGSTFVTSNNTGTNNTNIYLSSPITVSSAQWYWSSIQGTSAWFLQYSTDLVNWTTLGNMDTGWSTWTHTITFPQVTAQYFRIQYINGNGYYCYVYSFNFNKIVTYPSGAYKAVANDTDPKVKFAGFVQWPKAIGDIVTLNSNEWEVVGGFTGLTEWSTYYVGNVAGVISTTKGTIKYPIGIAKSSTNLLQKKQTDRLTQSATATSFYNGSFFVAGTATFYHYGWMMNLEYNSASFGSSASITSWWINTTLPQNTASNQVDTRMISLIIPEWTVTITSANQGWQNNYGFYISAYN